MADQHRIDELRRLFDRAIELPRGARTAFLDTKCRGDTELRRRVQAMLEAADAEAPPPPPQPPGARASAGAPAPDKAVLTEGPGTVLGPYKLLHSIGEGGFGAVFLAEQHEPVARRVALKILKLGMDTRQVVARFEQERQALALMDHPNIAKVLDAGATATGRPYFVMDYVQGEPIVEYCDRNRLTIRERLELAEQVCRAVQHAHGKGIIHRDIKPSNVLVCTQDGRPMAKIIDFGIAKATSARLTDKTLFTEQQQVVGTLQYMSPEQAAGQLDIDTRTDVYSLGVLVYELLTGSAPFDERRLKEGALSEMHRMVREVEPEKPSTRLSDSQNALPAIAAQRRIEPKRLGSMLRGELDCIVMKALEKDRARRYETANGLASDIRRYLAGEPVLAAPPSAAYLLRKYMRRHRPVVAGAAAAAAALLVGVVGFAWQARIAGNERDNAILAQTAEVKQRELAEASERTAARERDNALLAQAAEAKQRELAQQGERTVSAINDFLLDMLGGANVREMGPGTRLVDALDRAALKVGSAFRERPEVEAPIRRILARTYVSLGMLDRARPHVDAAVELAEEVHGPKSRELIMALRTQAQYVGDRGDTAGAVAILERALALSEETLGPAHGETIGTRSDYANALREEKREDQAETVLRQALATALEAHGRLNAEVQVATNSLAVLLHGRGQLDEAESLYREALAIGHELLGKDHPDTLTARMNLASMLHSRKKDAEAEPMMVETYADVKRVFGNSHASTATAAHVLALFYQSQDRAEEALALAREAEAIRVRESGERTEGAARSRQLAGQLLENLGRHDEAAAMLQKSVESWRAVAGPDSLSTLGARWNLAKNLGWARRRAEAETVYGELLADCERVLGLDHWLTIYSQNTYAILCLQDERFADAEPFARRALEAGRRAQGIDNANTLATQFNLASIVRGQGRLDEAEQLGLDMLERSGRALGTTHGTTSHAHWGYGRTLLARGRVAEAEREFEAALAIAKGRKGPFGSYALSLAQARVDAGKATDAEPVIDDALQAYGQHKGAREVLCAQLRAELGRVRASQQRFVEGEALLIASHDVMKAVLVPGHSDLRRVQRHLAEFYAAWNDAEPHATRAQKAQIWRQRAEAR